MQYQSYQYYSYGNLKELQEIIKVDGIGIMNIDEDEQIIEYQIDRSKCVRLSDLIYMITYNFLRFHLGQLLELFAQLLKKVISQQAQNHIQHQYLDTNRIWLVFKNESPRLSVVYTKIDYTIAFTGYQCQLFEKGPRDTKSADEQIQNIIKAILKKFKKDNIFFNPSKKNEIDNQIYDPIIQACDKLCIETTFEVIMQLQSKYELNKVQQTIQLDIQLENSKVDLARNQNLPKIEQQLKAYIYALKSETIFDLEFIILTQIENMIVPLENPKINFNKIEEHNEYFKEVKSIQQKTYIKRKEQLQSCIQQIIEDALKKMLEDYKFEFKQEEKQELNETVVNRILNLKLNKYFYNSPHYHLKISEESLLQQQLSLQSKLIQKVVNEEVQMLIYYHILLLIDDLI
ncbi:unnamed protein product (macronuclear) [Paramecium tetraurelia]|uniref:Uncharacterized protein n=1 Tax=Paramecium tetraurelia TaxID=5888 RepID=A0E9P3_PARTE|nr:uncharacterized protein GSPATT00024741001 [Paramecium tetraurelia]CAK92010.1 unnamed protein product [Paramecium tetraurelia]|eukprot:XP_001459407.1 hypothetical protein (macronuclear) [Paramecium tetraurelia strain d4-2]